MCACKQPLNIIKVLQVELLLLWKYKLGFLGDTLNTRLTYNWKGMAMVSIVK